MIRPFHTRNKHRAWPSGTCLQSQVLGEDEAGESQIQANMGISETLSQMKGKRELVVTVVECLFSASQALGSDHQRLLTINDSQTRCTLKFLDTP